MNRMSGKAHSNEGGSNQENLPDMHCYAQVRRPIMPQ